MSRKSVPPETLLEMKTASPQGRKIFCPIRWPKDVLLHNDWSKFAKFRLFGTETVCPKTVKFSQF